MKFLLFSDLHFGPGTFMGTTWDSLRQIQSSAEEECCEFIIHAGDFCHGVRRGSGNMEEGHSMEEGHPMEEEHSMEEGLSREEERSREVMDYIKAYNDFHIPSYHALGNHDTDKTPYEDMLKYYRMPDGHYYFDQSGYRMIVCDPNYFYDEGKYVHYSMGNYYSIHEKYGYYDSLMPPEQLAWLERTIAESPYPCVLISHESFEREGADGVKNGAEVRRIINEANRRKRCSVFLCINGHYHRDNIRILDNVCYWDLNAVSFEALEKPQYLYPKELYEKWSYLHGTLVYNDPLYAIVTLEGTTITIKGRESSFFMGITHEMTGNTLCDPAGRAARATIQSAKITLG